MATFPCAKPCIECPPPPPGAEFLGLSPNNPSNPFANLSSEAPDVDLFISRRFTPSGLGNPPLGSVWYSVGCLGFAISNVSQADADLLAAQQAVECTGNEWPTSVVPNPNVPPNPGDPPTPPEPPIITPRPVFMNQQQSCDFTCPDGSTYTYTVPAGLFSAFSQAAADAAAHSYACTLAVDNQSCFGPAPLERICSGASYSSSISVSSSNLPITFTFQSGDLPPGITPSQNTNTLFLNGTPTTPGDYALLLRATDSTGSFVEKAITISIFGIVNDEALPIGAVDEAYSETLVAAGAESQPVTYVVIAGALPDGLSLNSSTGEISGTPTTAEEAVFTVRISNGLISCDKQFALLVESADCPNWDELAWTSCTQNGSGVAFPCPVPAQSGYFLVSAGDGDCNFGQSQVVGGMDYSGTGCNCNLHIDWDGDASFGGVQVDVDGVTVINFQVGANPPGAYDFPFSLPDTAGGTIPIFVGSTMQPGGCETGIIEGTFSNTP